VSESRGPNNWNQKIIDEFHANAGKVGGYFEGAHMILIHHVGARSGRERVNPLTYLPDGDDMIIAATKGGAPSNPTGTTTSSNTLESWLRSEPRRFRSMRQR
jgi:F420H(2)-dependent quinone reductase